ncbi:hypothetical protein HPB48_017083 [Haemaphysalis longicornis]|uniref:Uncharacterized protein n=1 Tax=Haemaphysalis longicornis TaxID=44386 RepID=A0A9J6F9N7_HAELO|nr:hypothetical protein HPB48_017083 [Haemaphysalis longicornis]
MTFSQRTQYAAVLNEVGLFLIPKKCRVLERTYKLAPHHVTGDGLQITCISANKTTATYFAGSDNIVASLLSYRQELSNLKHVKQRHNRVHQNKTG